MRSGISDLVHSAFRGRDGSVRYTHIKLTGAEGYFAHGIGGGGDNMFTADSICEMIEFLIGNIFVRFGGCLFRRVVGVPVGASCAPLLADLFLYSYENEFLDNMIRSGHRRLARSFDLCYRYIDDLIVFNNKKFLDYLKEIYPSRLTVERANKSDHLADYLDLTFIIDGGGKLSTRLYDRRDDFDFHIVNFPFLSSNIPSGPSYGVCISQLIGYARCCSHYDDFRYRHKCLVDRLLSQGYKALRLEKSFKKFYGRYQDLIEKYRRSVSAMVSDSFPGQFLFNMWEEFGRFCYLHGFVTWICLYLSWLLAVAGVMHEANDAYSIWSTWSCYWLDQFLTLALDAWILSKFSTLYWICLLLVFLILVGVELPLCCPSVML